MAHVAFVATCPNGHPAAEWSATTPQMGDPLVTYDICCPRCNNAERFRMKWRAGSTLEKAGRS